MTLNTINIADYNDSIGLRSKTIALKVLFLLGHPDDEQYIAGSIQQCLANGHDVYVMFTTSGKNGTDLTAPGATPAEIQATREAEAVTSLTGLGVTLSKIYALRGDDVATDIDVITSTIASTLSTDGVVIDTIITFDNTGVYGHVEHSVCQRIGIEYYRQTATVKAIYYFTIPESDIIEDPAVGTGKDLTDAGAGSIAVNDSIVDYIYTLSAPQNTAKVGVLNTHVSQYEDPQKSLIQNHYLARPYEYFSVGQRKLNFSGFENFEYLRLLFTSI